jgi:hypothetical protein
MGSSSTLHSSPIKVNKLHVKTKILLKKKSLCRDCGFGKSRMEDYIIDEVRDTLDWLKSMNGKPIENIKYKLSLAVVSSLWTIISGQRVPHDDPFLSMMANGISE